jgi:hypothetical protein
MKYFGVFCFAVGAILLLYPLDILVGLLLRWGASSVIPLPPLVKLIITAHTALIRNEPYILLWLFRCLPFLPIALIVLTDRSHRHRSFSQSLEEGNQRRQARGHWSAHALSNVDALASRVGAVGWNCRAIRCRYELRPRLTRRCGAVGGIRRRIRRQLWGRPNLRFRDAGDSLSRMVALMATQGCWSPRSLRSIAEASRSRASAPA